MPPNAPSAQAPLSGLTWDHPRGRDALEEIARRAEPDAPIRWAVQPLEGFESAPIAELAAKHDVLVMDHPHIGEAVAANCLRPLEDIFEPAQLAAWETASIGPSMRSYRWMDRHWALPLDVACQTMARHPDALPDPPSSWEAVERLAESGRVAQSLAGPHAILSLMSMVGADGASVGEENFVPDDPAVEAIERMTRLYAARPRGTETVNPIGLLEATARGEISLIPLVFGYVTYSGHGVAFSDALRKPGGAGGVLGGTGLALTARAQPSPAAVAHLAHLMDAQVQRTVLPAHGGQPSARSAWTDPSVNEAAGSFYRDHIETAERALLRPRFDGYITFQTQASERLRNGLSGAERPSVILNDLRSLWSDARARARGPLASP